MKVNFSCVINSLSYGIAGFNLYKRLALNHEVALFPLYPEDVALYQQDLDILSKGIKNQENWDCKADSILLWHQFALQRHVGKGRHIGFPIFELDKFNDVELHNLNSQDEIIVCSKWAAQVLFDNKVQSIINVVPLGVDRNIYYEGEQNQNKNTVFLNIGKWEKRKGHDVLIECFSRAFTKNDNVELWLLPHNNFLTPQEIKSWMDLVYSSPLASKIRILPRLPSYEHVADLIRESDVGVFPSRAEGWNLPALEMLSCGKHLIITNNTAHTEFVNKENSHLIEVPEKELAFDNKWFHGQGNWGKITTKVKDNIIDEMKSLHDQTQSGNLGVNLAGIETAKKFSWNNSVAHIEGILYD